MHKETIKVVTRVKTARSREADPRWRDLVSVNMVDTLTDCYNLGMTEQHILDAVNYVRVLQARDRVRKARKRAGNGQLNLKMAY